MAPLSPILGTVSVQAGTAETADLVGQLGLDGATLTVNGEVEDATTDADNGLKTLVGLYDWTIAAPFKYPGTPQHGINDSGAFISGSGIYLTNVREYDLTIEAPAIDAATDADTGGKTYILGDVLRATGSYTAWVDSSTALGQVGATATATFVLADEATNDDAVVMPIVITSKTTTRARGSAPVQVTYGFQSNGTLQYIGDNGLFGTAATNTNIPIPTYADTLRVSYDATPSRYADGLAGWSSINIRRGVQGVVGGTVNFRGSGALTLA